MLYVKETEMSGKLSYSIEDNSEIMTINGKIVGVISTDFDSAEFITSIAADCIYEKTRSSISIAESMQRQLVQAAEDMKEVIKELGE